ncbi:MAG: excinuclease ABC subunit UvrC [Oscillospiraceae bacterium]|jgi:excinuclease ABC subunit C|nr:excinuclease ABC subunit UvrC [Oscillospiraceae bacterium]
MSDTLREKANALPRRPGVYIMLDKSGEVIYVGKAVALRNRVSSYFYGAHEPKTELMVSKVADFDVIIASSEFEALVLENQLIKHHMPKYNIRLRDDKGHPFIRVDPREAYPRFTVVSKRRDDGARYLGPYGGRNIAHSAIDAVSKAFGLPSCSRRFPRDIGRERPCLSHHLGVCRGWCLPGTDIESGSAGFTNIINTGLQPGVAHSGNEEYSVAVRSAITVFDGRANKLIDEITREMEAAAADMRFERAAELRDRLRAVKELKKRQSVVSDALADTDAIGYFRGEAKSCFVALHYIDGRLLDKDFELFDTPVEDGGEAISGLLRQYYLRREAFPREILVPFEPEDSAELETLFAEAARRRVTISHPRRGEKLKLIKTAAVNAREEAERATTREEKIRGTIEWLGKAMGLERPPVRIEAFDISNTGSEDIVASMTVFDNGKPKKNSYKRFAIKSTETQDDYRSMEEVVTRRARHFIDGDEAWTPLPDVMLIDGGQAHASVAAKAIAALDPNISVPVFGMVKDSRHRTRALVTPDGMEIGIDANPAAFALIGTIQEETHRFAITFHRERRSKTVRKSKLDEAPGVGETRRKALLRAFGSLEAIKAASVDDLAKIVPRAAAEAVYALFVEDRAGE